MNGDSVVNTQDFNAPTMGASGPGTLTLMGAEDVNGDGYSDLLSQNTANGDVVATEMTAGLNVLANVNLGAPASSFHLVASTGGG